jgi:hypothetical protein
MNRCCFCFLDSKHFALIDIFIRRYTNYRVKEQASIARLLVFLAQGRRRLRRKSLAAHSLVSSATNDTPDRALAPKYRCIGEVSEDRYYLGIYRDKLLCRPKVLSDPLGFANSMISLNWKTTKRIFLSEQKRLGPRAVFTNALVKFLSSQRKLANSCRNDSPIDFFVCPSNDILLIAWLGNSIEIACRSDRLKWWPGLIATVVGPILWQNR